METLRDRRATSIEKGDVASLDSVNDPHREHLRLRHLLVGDKSKRANKVARPFSFWEGSAAALPSIEYVMDFHLDLHLGSLEFREKAVLRYFSAFHELPD